MHILWTLLIGLVIGAVAKFIMPGKDPGGIIVTMLIGIAGSFIATYAGRALGWYQEGQTAGFINVGGRVHCIAGCLSPGQAQDNVTAREKSRDREASRKERIQDALDTRGKRRRR